MKLLLAFLLLTLTVTSYSQVTDKYTVYTIYGAQYNRVKVPLVLTIPSDTTNNKDVGSIAVKNGVFYIKNTTAWVQVSGSGSTTPGPSYANHVYTGLWLLNTNDSTVKADSAAMSAYFLRRKDSTSLYVTPTQLAAAIAAASGGSGIEVDPTVASYIKAITTTDISNWNTAFGWGNHASMGYLLPGDTVNTRPRYNAGTNIVITGTFPNYTISTPSSPYNFPDILGDPYGNVALAAALDAKLTIPDSLVMSVTPIRDSASRPIGQRVRYYGGYVMSYIFSDTTSSGGSGGSGTVTSVSVTTANGVSGSVATSTTTPAITLTLGAITPLSVAASGTVTGSNLSGTNTGDQDLTAINDTLTSHNSRIKLNTQSIATNTASISTNSDSITAHNTRILNEISARISADNTKFTKSGDSASYVWFPNQVNAIASPANGITEFDSSGRLHVRTSLGKTYSISTSSITANTSVIDTLPNKSGTLAMVSDVALKENALGNPSTNGYVLASTTSGTRSWVAQSGGSASDSSFNTLDVGVSNTLVGTLLNESFAGTSIPASFSKGANLTATYNNKAIITGANFWTAPTLGQTTIAWGAGMQYNTRRMPYEKMDVVITVVPQTKSAGGVIALTKGRLDNAGGLINSLRPTIAWDMSDSYTSGRVSVGYDSISSFASSPIDSSSRAVWSAGDSLQLYIHYDGLGTTAGIYNKTTGVRTSNKFTTLLGTGGRWNFIFIKGTYHVINVKATSYNRKGGVYFVGTSQTAGVGVSQQVRRFAEQIFNADEKYYSVWGMPSLSAKAFVAGSLTSELIADAQPSKVVLEHGYNDESDPTTAPIFSQSIDSIIYPLQRSGITVYTMGIVPRQSATDIYNDTLALVAARRNSTFIDIRTPLLNGGTVFFGGYNKDGVHINDDANTVVANATVAKIGNEILAEPSLDSLSPLKIYSIPWAQTEDVNRVLGIKGNNEVVIMPYYASKSGTGINNVYNTSSSYPKTVAQSNSALHTSGEIRTNSYFQNGNNGYGLRIGFNNDTNSVTATNIEVGNSGVAGTGIGQVFRNWPVDGYNISMGGHTKVTALGSPTSATKNNIGFGQNNLQVLTSGAGNFEAILGNVFSTVTTASNTINLSNNIGPATASNQIIIGDGSALSWGDVANSIIIGKRNTTGDTRVAGDAIIEPGNNISSTLWLGGKTTGFNVAAGYFLKPPTTGSTGGQPQLGVGNDIRIAGGQSFSTIHKGGSVGFQTALPATNTTFADRFTVTNDVATATTGLQMTSTTKGLIPSVVTQVQRDKMIVVQSVSISAGGTGYTDGAALVFSGGSPTTAAVGFVRVTGGVITSIVLSYEGAGYASAPTVSVAGGTGATLTVTAAIPSFTTVICSDCTATDASTGVMQIYQSSTSSWKNAW